VAPLFSVALFRYWFLNQVFGCSFTTVSLACENGRCSSYCKSTSCEVMAINHERCPSGTANATYE